MGRIPHLILTHMNIAPTLPQAATRYRLASLLGHTSLETFLAEYWEKQTLIVDRQDKYYYQDLFTIETVDQVLDMHRPSGARLRVVRNQEPFPSSKYENADGSLNLNQLYAAYADGYTLVINEIDQFAGAVKQMCQSLSQQLSHHVGANMYLTPKHQTALSPHYDTHDVFVIQVHGEKHWKLYDSPMETPLLHSFQPIFRHEQLSGLKEITLRAGDMMYLPRGVPHEAYTTDDSSIHLAVGIHSAQWVDLITHAVKQVAMADPALRKALPPGYLLAGHQTQEALTAIQETFSQVLATVSQKANVHGAMHMLSEELRGKQPPRGDGHFKHIDQLDLLDLDTRVAKREGLSCSVQRLGNAVRIVFPGNMIKGPAPIARTFDFICKSDESFAVHELPVVSDANKLKLVKRLIRGGLLRIC